MYEYIHVQYIGKYSTFPREGGMVSADNIWEDMKKEMITGGNYERKKVKDNWKMKRTVNAKRVREKGKKCD
jgi:hypothetical protein